MTVSVQRYRKQPVEVDTMRWDGGAEDAGAIIDWILKGAGRAGCGGTARYVGEGEWHMLRQTDDDTAEFMVIDTLEGAHRMDVGDIAIQGVAGEFYPCKPDIFAATYAPAE